MKKTDSQLKDGVETYEISVKLMMRTGWSSCDTNGKKKLDLSGSVYCELPIQLGRLAGARGMKME